MEIEKRPVKTDNHLTFEIGWRITEGTIAGDIVLAAHCPVPRMGLIAGIPPYRTKARNNLQIETDCTERGERGELIHSSVVKRINPGVLLYELKIRL
jgi:hypothetical protein